MHFLSVQSLTPIITLISVALARSAHSAKYNNTLPAYPAGGHKHVNTTIPWSGGKVKEEGKITVVTVVIKKPVTTICVTKTSGSESGVVQTYTTYTGPGPVSSKPSSPNNAAYTTSTILSTLTYTITSCAPTVTKCPVGLVTQTVYTYTTVCPISGGVSSSLSSAPYKNASTSATEISTGSGTVTLSSSSGSVTLPTSSSLSSESTSLSVSETVLSSTSTLSTSESVVVSSTSSASSDIPTSSSVTSDLPTSSIPSSSLSSSTSESSSSEITSSDVPSSTSEVLSSSSTYSSFSSSSEELSSSATTSSELSSSSVYSSVLSSTTETSASETISSYISSSTSEALPSSSIYSSVASSTVELSSSEVVSSVLSSSTSLSSSETSTLVIPTSSAVLSSSSEIGTPTSSSSTSDVVSSSSIVVIETTSSSSTSSLVSSTVDESSSSSTLSSTSLILSSSSIVIVSSTSSSDLPSSTSIIATTSSSSSSVVLSSSSSSITPTTSTLGSSTSVFSSSDDSSSTSVSSVRSSTSYPSSPSSSTRVCVGRCGSWVEHTPSSSMLSSSSKSTALSSSTSPISSTSSSASSSLSSSLSSSAVTSSTLTSSSQTSSLSSSSSITSSSSSKVSSTSSSTSSSATPTPTLPACYYWMEEFKHQGIAPFAATPGTYQVFRNVKDFGAKGDGVTDDTAAINLAISTGGRCASEQCESTTTTPAIVYFPSGTYLVSSPVIDYYYTQMIGNPNCMPVIKASASFTARWVVDADVYVGDNLLGYGATNVFWRQMRNFVIDTTSVPVGREIAGIHWPTAQATSLQNMVFKMSAATGTKHEGVFSESGSGGFMTDLVFYGGLHGCLFANQQFTMRNLTFYNAVTAISQAFDWGWTYKGLSINNCGTGIDMTSLSVGSITLVDSIFVNTPVAISTNKSSTSSPPLANTLIIENVQFTNVQTIVTGSGGTTLLPGSAGSITVAGWGQGHSYSGTSGPNIVQGPITPNVRSGLTAGADFYERSKPQYEKLPTSQFVSVRDAGAKGDGVTDDSDVLNSIIAAVALAGKIVFFDAGDYVVTKPIYIPAGSRITGEAYPVILSSGAYFNDINNPKPVVQVGKPGETGNVEWSDMIVSTRGAQAGAILIEWNLASTGTPAGMWDVHTRIGGFAGSNLQLADCPKTPDTVITSVPPQCIAAFMSMHITAGATGLYMENVWLWVADHDVEDASVTQITVYAGRGLLIESTLGSIWLYGTASEHHTLYQYQLTNTANIFIGHIQTETAYYQPNPSALIPFPANSAYSDPIMAPGASGWALRVINSKQVLIYGAGLYSFFNNYNVHCSDQGNGSTCQQRIMSVENSKVSVYGLATIGSVVMYTQDGVDGALSAANGAGFATSVMLYRS